MKIALFWMIAIALADAHATEACPTAVVVDAIELQNLSQQVEALVAMIPAQLQGVPAEKQSRVGEQMLNTYHGNFFRRVRAFRDKHGDVNCVADLEDFELAVNMRAIYAKLDRYEAEHPTPPDCESSFASAYRETSLDIKETMAAIEDFITRTKRSGGETTEKTKRDYAQILEVLLNQTKRFRSQHPEKFLCQVAPGRIADSESMDSYSEVTQAELNRTLNPGR